MRLDDADVLAKLGKRIDRNTGKPISEVMKEAGQGIAFRDLGEAAARSVPAAPEKKPRAKPRQLEHNEQVSLFDFLRNHEKQYPVLTKITANPLSGKRSKAAAGKMKAEGQKKGVPDITCYAARRGYHGLVIEMKIYPNDLTPEQADWFSYLTAEGWLCEKHYRWEEAAKLIFWYLDIPIKIVERGK